MSRCRGLLRLPALTFGSFLAVAWVANWVLPAVDVKEYAFYAAAALAHPLGAWPREYPPLALAVFLLPRLLPFGYRPSFMLLAAAAFVGLGVLQRGDAAGTAGRRHRLAVYLLLATAFISFQRYDIFAAIPAFLGVRAAERGRWRAAWTWSLLGVWLKLYPVVFWPLWLVAEWRERGRWRWDRLAVAAALAIMPTVAVTLSGTGGHWVGFLVNRPANLGSVPGDLAAVLTGNYRYRMTYGAYVVNAALAGPLSLLADGLGMAVMAVVLARVARGRMSLRAGGVMVLWTLILSSKVFSPQYLIWVAPLMAGFDLDWRWLLGAFWTTLAFPLAYLAPSGSWILVHRADWYFIQDIFLIWGLAVFFRRQTRSAVAGEMGGRLG